MKKSLPYFIAFVAIIALVLLLASTSVKGKRTLNQRISLRKTDKIPYGFYAAKQLAKNIFPKAIFYTDKRAPGYWDSLLLTGSGQAVFLIGDLNADDDELLHMQDFVKEGNYVFIICKSLSYDAISFFDFEVEDVETDDNFLTTDRDSLRVRLNSPRFSDNTTYMYPGRRYSGHFNYVAPERALVLGINGAGHANFVQFKAGAGAIFLHTAPLAFSNYFILHKNNIRYFEQALSVIPKNVKKVVWNEYYLYKKNDNNKEDEPNWLGVLFKYTAFKWALLTAVLTLLLYVVLEMRRRQKVMPEYARPANASLDFVQTIGRLYYDKKNHADLARKMSIYFLEHVREKYKLLTNELDEEFIQSLSYKSGYDKNELRSIISFILFISGQTVISEDQLIHFHTQVEKFYQTT